MARKAKKPWTVEEQAELDQLFDAYLLAMRRMHDRHSTYDYQAYADFWASELPLSSHRGFALLTLPILERMQSERRADDYARGYELERLLRLALAAYHPEHGKSTVDWDTQRFQTVLGTTEYPMHLHAIARRLQSSRSKAHKEFFYRTWVDAWLLRKTLPPNHPKSQKQRAILVAFLSEFRPVLLFGKTHQYLCEIMDSFVPMEPQAFSPLVDPMGMYAEIPLFRAALSALKRLNTPESLGQIKALCERMQSPDRVVQNYDTPLLLSLREAYAETFPLEEFAWLFTSLQDNGSQTTARLTAQVTQHGLDSLVHWNLLLRTLFSRLRREPITYRQQAMLFRSLASALKRMAWVSSALRGSYLVHQTLAAKFLKSLGRLHVPFPAHLPTQPTHPYIRLSCFQVKCAQSLATSEQEALVLLQSQESSIRNGALYALSEHSNPAMRRLFLRSLFVSGYHERARFLMHRLREVVHRVAEQQTQPPLATDWMHATSDEEALLSALLFLVSGPHNPLAGTCALHPMEWIRRMVGQQWPSLQRLLASRSLPTPQANREWLALLRGDATTEDKETGESATQDQTSSPQDIGASGVWSAWLLWPLAAAPDASCVRGPQRHPAVAAALVADLLQPSDAAKEHRLKSAWLLRFGDALLADALHQQATPQALDALDKATKGRIQRLLLRLDPRTLKGYHIDLEASLFS